MRMEGKTTLIFGGGDVSEWKVKKLLHEAPNVIIISKVFTAGLRELEQQGKVKLVEADVEADFSSVAPLVSQSDMVISATDNNQLNSKIAREAKKRGVLACAVDRPSISDFFQPAVARVGSIRVAVCTDGKSPLMARILRKRIEEIITREDALHVELQSYARKLAKIHIPDRRSRRETLHQIFRNPEIGRLIKGNNFEEAKKRARQIIESY